MATVNGVEMIELLARIVELFQIIFEYPFAIIFILVLMQIVYLYIYIRQHLKWELLVQSLRKKNKQLEAKNAFQVSINLSWAKYFDKIIGPKVDPEWKQILESLDKKV